MSQPRTALVIVMSEIARDPRVRHQIDWLTETGWVVDTIGLGHHSADNVRDHFVLSEEPRWVNTSFGTAFIYGILPHHRKFKVLTQNRIPTEVQSRVQHGSYQLIVFNDRHFVPWIADKKIFTAEARRGHIHLDLHEYFVPRLKRDSLWRIATNSYYSWARKLFADPTFDSRSAVSSGIGKLYADELGTPEFAIVRNSPPFENQKPREVDPNEIKLIHHGMASWNRGLPEIVDAMRLVDDKFSMTFMLFGSDEVITRLREYASGLGDRVRIIPPVPMRDLSKVVNHYDLEILFFPPTTLNLHYVLPNKLFEAVQGRLGLVIGESPMMVELVEAYANGIVATGWTATDLAAAINSLSAEEVASLKAASDRAAQELNSETERAVFLEIVGAEQRSQHGPTK